MKPIGDVLFSIGDWLRSHWRALELLFTAAAFITAVLLLKATQEQNEIVREQGHKELRAYLTLIDVEDSLDIWVPTRTGRKLDMSRLRMVHWTLKNLGRTPAYEVRLIIFLVVTDSVPGDPRDFAFADSVSTTIGSGLSVPKWSVVSSGRWSGKERIYLVGKIQHRDIFHDYHA